MCTWFECLERFDFLFLLKALNMKQKTCLLGSPAVHGSSFVSEAFNLGGATGVNLVELK